MIKQYYQVLEVQQDKKRLVYTFTNETAAHDLVELIYKSDPMPVDLIVECYEVTT